MKSDDKTRLIELGQQLTAVGVEFRIAQIGLEKAVEEYGMSSEQAVEAAQLCSELSLQFSNLEEEFLTCKAQVLAKG